MAKTPDTHPGGGATEADARGPVRVLVVNEQPLFYRPNEANKTARAVVRDLPGLSATFVDTKNPTLNALKMLRRAKKEGRPFDIVLSGWNLVDGYGAIQISETAQREGLAEYFVIFSFGSPPVRPEDMQRRGIDAIVAYPNPERMAEAMRQGMQSVAAGPQQASLAL